MPKIKYREWKPKPSSVEAVRSANEILEEYREKGFELSLRQLYYQFVQKNLIANTEESYKRLGSIITNARDNGLVDWYDIEDRGRSVYHLPHYDSGEDFVKTVVDRFHLDLWEGQPVKVMVWVEKDALSDIISRVSNRWDCAYFACKGYVSSSAMWYAAQSMLTDDCAEWVILHLGDHDPSGIDMTRDIQERLNLYLGNPRSWQVKTTVEVSRIALNMDQIEEYNPPPNPAKITDSRFKEYQSEYGDESWELDALSPEVLDSLIDEAIQEQIRYSQKYRDRVRKQERIKKQLQGLKF